jgi:acyl-CoA thioester hydrolase
MARVKLDLPDKFDFSTEISVRITDLNYGGHVGNDSALSLTNEARVRFLNANGFGEVDVGGPGLLVANAVIIYKSPAVYGDLLRIEVAVSSVAGYVFDLVYRLTNKETGREVARAKTGMVFYDYDKGKPAKAPERFRSTFHSRER